MGFKVSVSGCGFRVEGQGFAEFGVQDSGFWVWDLGFRVEDFQSLGFGVLSFGCWVWGFDFRV